METKLLKRCLTTAVKFILGNLQNFNLVSFRGTFYQFSNQFTIYRSAFVFMILYFKPVLIYVQIYLLKFLIINPEDIQLCAFTKKLKN